MIGLDKFYPKKSLKMISLDLPDPLKQQATLSSNPNLIKESIVLQSTAKEDVKSHGSIFFLLRLDSQENMDLYAPTGMD